MTHPDASALIALLRGEHPWLRATRLRQHLKHCPRCAVELKELTTMLEAVAPPKSGADAALAAQVWSALPVSRPRPLPLRPLGLVGAVALAAAASLFFFRPAPSFAQVEAAMGKLQTVHWSERDTVQVRWDFEPKKGGHLVASSESTQSQLDCWAEVTKPRLAQRVVGSHEDKRYYTTPESQLVYHRYPSHRSYMTFPVFASRSRFTQEKILDQILLPENDPTRTEKEHTQKRTFLPWKQTEGIWKGKRQLLFTRQVREETRQETLIRTITVWVDPYTHRITRREEVTTFAGSPKPLLKRIAEDFRYNDAPPVGTFEAPQPKVGEAYTVYDHLTQYGNKPQNEQETRVLVQEALAAYQRGDTAAFHALWDTEEPLPKLAKLIPYKTCEYAAYTTEDKAVAHFTFRGGTGPSPLPAPLLSATLECWVSTEAHPAPFKTKAYLSLVKRGPQWKIRRLRFAVIEDGK